jgi:hypothetical protein
LPKTQKAQQVWSVLQDTVLRETILQETVLQETVFQETVLQETVLQKTVSSGDGLDVEAGPLVEVETGLSRQASDGR